MFYAFCDFTSSAYCIDILAIYEEKKIMPKCVNINMPCATGVYQF